MPVVGEPVGDAAPSLAGFDPMTRGGALVSQGASVSGSRITNPSGVSKSGTKASFHSRPAFFYRKQGGGRR